MLPADLPKTSAGSSRSQSDSGRGPKINHPHLCGFKRTTVVCAAAGNTFSSFDRRGDSLPQGTPRRFAEQREVLFLKIRFGDREPGALYFCPQEGRISKECDGQCAGPRIAASLSGSQRTLQQEKGKIQFPRKKPTEGYAPACVEEVVGTAELWKGWKTKKQLVHPFHSSWKTLRQKNAPGFPRIIKGRPWRW
jgi:hypothetical protein